MIIQFAPHLIPLSRGIITTIHADPVPEMTAQSLEELYETAYGSEWFIRLLGSNRYPDIKNVVGTNRLELAWRVDPRTGRVILMSAVDNLVKGASGQAIQNMNLVLGYPETKRSDLECSETSRQKSLAVVSGETAFQPWNRHFLKSVEVLPLQKVFVPQRCDVASRRESMKKTILV